MWKAVVLVFATVFTLGSAAATGGLVGGARDVDANDEGVVDALNFAVAEHNKANNDLYLSQVAEVIRAQTQVVSGLKYIITARMGRTTCRKGSPNEVCAVHEDPEMARPYQCTFTIWSRPWIPSMQVSEKCNK